MKIRLWNNEATDYVDYEADTIEEIRDQCAGRIKMESWKDGHSEVLAK